MTYDLCPISSIKDVIEQETQGYEEKISGARERLTNALEIIIVAYYANLVKKHSDDRFEAIFNGK
jgi:hypothetical protein